ncbi:hypothetical protein MA16_Dca012898 [Dendrobium catenatum]|uniref:Uncharacterized protein n=1 Tax=Dendrobium catenatum TaxID=906689 RepID=A0A2I0W1M4_9ASPA|nr:hypothetical protein MA16_Dca012898 [Dendrobium catenatum]
MKEKSIVDEFYSCTYLEALVVKGKQTFLALNLAIWMNEQSKVNDKQQIRGVEDLVIIIDLAAIEVGEK